jgi:Alginate lyase
MLAAFKSRILKLSIVTVCMLPFSRSSNVSVAAADVKPAPTVFWDGSHLAAIRAGNLNSDAQINADLRQLRKNADSAVKRGPYSVMQKEASASSGDKHDYLSYARYWWPNPDTPDGLPYIRRDGRTNSEAIAKGDRATLGLMIDDVETLSLAGYLLDDQRYAERAATLVRAWFLDPATKMNPHLRFGQAIRGRNDGRGSGIIDTRHFIRVLDSVALLDQAGAWTTADQSALTAWMKQYFDWLQHDPQAQNERSGHNNHGTWYDAQVASIAMFVGERDVARSIVESAKENRVGKCIQPDGSQPAELARTRSLHYSVFDLSAMSVIARIGEHVDVDLWNYSTSDGRSIRNALDYLLPYLLHKKPWPHEQIGKVSIAPSDLGLFYIAAARLHEPMLLQVLDELDRTDTKSDYAGLQFSRN